MGNETARPRFDVAAQLRQTATSAFIAGVLMLLFGYYLYSGNYRGVTDSQVYNASVVVFVWTLLVGGAAMLLSAVLCLLQSRWALLFDAVATGSIGALLLVIGVIQITSGGADLNTILMLVFGVMFLRSASISWGGYRDLPGGLASPDADEPEKGREEAASPEPAAPDKAEAMKHLLERKERLTGKPEGTVTGDKTASGHPQQTAATGPSPDQGPPRAAETQKRLEKNLDAPPPGGYLADLGKDDK